MRMRFERTWRDCLKVKLIEEWPFSGVDFLVLEADLIT